MLFLFLFNCASETAEGGQQRRRQGFSISQASYARIPLAGPLTRGAARDNIPGAYSLKKFTPEPGDQDDHPTNAAWAVVYGAFTCMKALERPSATAAEVTAMAFSPGYLYAVAVGDSASSCEKGISITDALDAMTRIGTVQLKDYPDDCMGTPAPALTQKAFGNRINAYLRLFGDQFSRKELPLKKSLVAGKPVVVALWYVSSFEDGEEVWTPKPEESSRTFGDLDPGVAVTVVGYDDSRSGGAFEVMNSLGTGWGTGGFCWIPYRIFDQFCAQAFEMIVDSTIGPMNDIHIPDIAPSLTVEDATISGCVRFLDLYQREMTASHDGEVFRLSNSYSSGSKFKIQIAAWRETFVYVICSDDSSRHTTAIFPDARFHYDDHLTPNSQVTVPPVGMGYIELDTTAGLDHFCFLFSRKYCDIADLSQRIDRGIGSFVQRVQAAVSEESVALPEMNYPNDGSVSFWTADKNKAIALLFVDMQHIR